MIYQFNSRVRYSEVNAKKEMSLVSIINYFQDVTTFHSEAIGLGIEHLKEKNRAWMLSAWQIVINRRPVFGESIEVMTWPYGFNGFYGDRNFMLRDESGETVVYANSLWIFVDTVTGRPARISEEELKGYVLEPEYPMEKAPRKIVVPEGGKAFEPVVVQKHHLDTNMHMNNGQYVQLAQEYLPEGFQVKEIRVQYCKAALLHDTMIPWVYQSEGGHIISLCDEAGRPFAVMEFK